MYLVETNEYKWATTDMLLMIQAKTLACLRDNLNKVNYFRTPDISYIMSYWILPLVHAVVYSCPRLMLNCLLRLIHWRILPETCSFLVLHTMAVAWEYVYFFCSEEICEFDGKFGHHWENNIFLLEYNQFFSQFPRFPFLPARMYARSPLLHSSYNSSMIVHVQKDRFEQRNVSSTHEHQMDYLSSPFCLFAL